MGGGLSVPPSTGTGPDRAWAGSHVELCAVHGAGDDPAVERAEF